VRAQGETLDLEILRDYYRLFERESELEEWLRETKRR
jgi:hypothetical protein